MLTQKQKRKITTPDLLKALLTNVIKWDVDAAWMNFKDMGGALQITGSSLALSTSKITDLAWATLTGSLALADAPAYIDVGAGGQAYNRATVYVDYTATGTDVDIAIEFCPPDLDPSVDTNWYSEVGTSLLTTVNTRNVIVNRFPSTGRKSFVIFLNDGYLRFKAAEVAGPGGAVELKIILGNS